MKEILSADSSSQRVGESDAHDLAQIDPSRVVLTSKLAKPVPPKRIIVLDDEETMRDLIKLFVERHTPNIAFEMCKNGNEAMDRLLDGNPAMFITDICHPKLDAYAMLTWIESRQAAFPIIIVSGNDATCLMDRFASTLNIQFFPKPITIGDFANIFPTANASDKKIPHHD